MRDWLLIIGGLLILGVLGHGLWIAWRSRREEFRIRYERDIPDLDLDDIDLLRAELPSGGARVVSRPEGESEAATDARGPDEEPVPVLLDSVDATSEVDDGTGAPAREDEGEPAASPSPQATRKVSPRPAPRPEPKVAGSEESRPEAGPAAEAPVRRKPETVADSEAEPAASREPEQAPLFAGEPIVARDKGAPRGQRRRQQGSRDGRERRAEPAEQDAAVEEFEDVLVINVLRRPGHYMAGPELLDLVTENGLRYGDMNIFHAYGAGQRIEFSMASAVKPGTFDLGAIDDLETPGVTFFLRLPGPDQPLEAFDRMAGVARDLASRLDADLKDERHSVMTAQTLEHCRQRIREFRRRQMSRRG